MSKDDYRGINDLEDLAERIYLNCGFIKECIDYPGKCDSCKFNHLKTSYYQKHEE
jgi:hypothetical protein